jgi:HSP20 family protein
MALATREPGTALARLHDEIDRMIENFTFPALPSLWPGATPEGWSRRWMPAINLYEKENNLIVEAELPGIPKDAVKINCTDHTLTIQGETKKEEEEKKEGYYRMERRYGSFYRSVPLPENVDYGKAKAEFKDGVLTITLPKVAKPEEKGRTIPISA